MEFHCENVTKTHFEGTSSEASSARAPFSAHNISVPVNFVHKKNRTSIQMKFDEHWLVSSDSRKITRKVGLSS